MATKKIVLVKDLLWLAKDYADDISESAHRQDEKLESALLYAEQAYDSFINSETYKKECD